MSAVSASFLLFMEIVQLTIPKRHEVERLGVDVGTNGPGFTCVLGRIV